MTDSTPTPETITRVILESPYAGDVARNTVYARRAMHDSIVNHGEAPMVSHLLYTQCLDDADPTERRLGINAGHAFLKGCERVVVYRDYGLSDGITKGMRRAKRAGVPIVFRNIGPNPPATSLRAAEAVAFFAIALLGAAATLSGVVAAIYFGG